MSELAHTTTSVHTPQGSFGQGGSRGRGGNGRGSFPPGGRGGRHGGRAGYQGARVGYQQGSNPVCNDFLKGKCNRPRCKFKH